MKDLKLCDIMNYLKCNEFFIDEERVKRVMVFVLFYEMVDDVFYYIWVLDVKGKCKEVRRRLVILRILIDEVLIWCYDDYIVGYLVFYKMYYKIRERFFWEGMYKNIDFWCKFCVNCVSWKIFKGRKRVLMLFIFVDGLFDWVVVDVLGLLLLSLKGNCYIVVFLDYLIRWVEVFIILNVDVKIIVKLFVEEIICWYLVFCILFFDRGCNFILSLMKEVCEIVNIKKIFIIVYYF